MGTRPGAGDRARSTGPRRTPDDEYEHVVGRVEAQELRSLLSGLSRRERMVLRSHYGLAGPERSLEDIAAELGVSAERVRQIRQRALGKLRAAAAGAA